MLSLLIKGLIIGFIVSAPVGPIGILCIQRTLSKGRSHGIATAVGATISDLMYAFIAIFSMSFVIDFINTHQFILRLLGCAAIFIYGLYTYVDNPIKKLHKMKPTKDYFQSALSSFGLTITNPLVILLFIALFAKFNFMTEDMTMADKLLGMAFIMTGAILWWVIMVSCVNLFRDRFNIRGLYLLNRVTGIILMALSIGVFAFWIMEPNGLL